MRKRRAQEPGGEGCTFPPRSPLQASLGDETAERCDFVTHPRGGVPETIKVLLVSGQRQGGHRAGKRSTMGAEPPAGSACLSPAPRSSARLGSTRLRSAAPGSARARPAPPGTRSPRPASGVALPASPGWGPEGARPGGRTWAAGGSGENRGGVSSQSRAPSSSGLSVLSRRPALGDNMMVT